jgi:hypothetical protein
MCHAQPVFKNGDNFINVRKVFVAGNDSPSTALCIAATTSNKALRNAIDEHQIKHRQLKNLSCNGLPVSRIAKKYGGFKLSI